MKEQARVAIIQDSSVPFDAAATASKTCRLIGEAAAGGAELVVFPEAFLGTYPKGLTFDAPIGRRKPEGREAFRRYYDGAVEMTGPELRDIAKAARTHRVFVVLGIIERDGGTLYCTVAYIDGEKGVVGKHRKLMPTGAERLIWGFGDGSTLDLVDTPLGRIGAVICWENYMPGIRMAMYAQGIELYCAPTADDRPTWAGTIQHIAMEGRCYVLSACQFITHDEFGAEYRTELGTTPGDIVMRGGSMIAGPLGEIIAGPVWDQRAILYADLDRATLIRARMDFDPVGHYARPDVFSLNVDRQPKRAVNY
jgi:nitrilase